jgi:hypothetical protein
MELIGINWNQMSYENPPPKTMNLIGGIQEEIDRVKGVIKIYDEVPNGAGRFASAMMQLSINEANSLIAMGDTVGMMKALKDLQSYEL